MPTFQYKAKEGPDKVVQGAIDAADINAAIQQIIQKGLAPLDVSLGAAKADERTEQPVLGWRWARRVRLKDIVLFTRQMSDLVGASVPILRALQVVSHQTQNIILKQNIERMYEHVRDGGSLSEALAEFPDLFSTLYVNMVRTAEVSGKLDLVFSRLSAYLEKDQETRSKVASSLAYPGFILSVGILTVFVLLTFVIPRLAIMFEDMEQDLPTITMVVMGISGFLAAYWWIFVIGAALVALYVQRWYQTEQGRRACDLFLLQAPLIGAFIRDVEVGRFARTLGTLLDSGVVITTALRSVGETITNVIVKDDVKKIAEEVEKGESLREALNHCRMFPEMASNMMAIGEETGRLEKGLYKVADTLERQSDQTTKTLLSLLGPAILVFIVSIVGCVVIALLLPIFQMNLIIQ